MDQRAASGGEADPVEARMVKKFRRSAAGYEEQIPSDLRPPPVLKATCDYLFNEVVESAPSLAKVHHFVWDRTRAIRNDLSILQVTKPDDVRIAIDCYERIARFHIVSLHQLALDKQPYSKYDAHQEREQLDRTLLSLLQYYEDNKNRIELPNEAEFRAYTVIFQLHTPVSDLEDRMQTWAPAVLNDGRVRKALEIYNAACNTFDDKGPLKPSIPHVIAREDWEYFWELINSPAVSYIMGCVAEIYFNLVRYMALKSLVRTARVAKAPNGNTDWTMDEVWEIFNFDDESQLIQFCERFGLEFHARPEDGKEFLDLSSLAGRSLPDIGRGATQGQLKSSLVENKRHGRTLAAVINGMDVGRSIDAGMTEEVSANSVDGEADSLMDDMIEEEDHESLFVPEAKPVAPAPQPRKSVFDQAGGMSNGPPTINPFAPPSVSASMEARPTGGLRFGAPSASPAVAAPVANEPRTAFSFSKLPSSATPSAATQPQPQNPFSFTKPPNQEESAKEQTVSANKPLFDFSKTTATPTKLSDVSAESSAPAKSLFSFSNNTPTTTPSWSASSLLKPEAANDKAAGLLQPPAVKTSIFGQASPFSKNAAPDGASPAAITPSNVLAPGFSVDHGSSIFTSTPGAVSPSQSGQPVPPHNSTPFGSPSKPSTFGQQQTIEQTRSAETTSTISSEPTKSLNDSSATNNTAVLQPSPQPSAKTAATFDKLPRPSNTSQHKPKSPSPLINSFTAGDGAPSFKPTSTSTIHDTKRAQASAAPSPSQPSIDFVEPVICFDELLSRLAIELIECPGTGFLDQFIEFNVSQIVAKMQEKVTTELLIKEADEFRQFCLSLRYGKLWRDICRHRRLAKQARERRNRAHRRLQEFVKSDTQKNSASVPSAKERSILASVSDHRLSHSAASDNLPKAGSKRSASATVVATTSSHEASHKRFKSTSRLESQHMVNGNKNPSADGLDSSDENHADFLKRSAFLDASQPANGVHRTLTTKSTYFRMKALGHQPVTNLSNAISLKRSRSKSIEENEPEAITPQVTPSNDVGVKPTRDVGTMLPPPRKTSKPTPVEHEDEDELLFARLRTARESLKEGAAFMTSEVAKDEELRKSTGSQSEGDSPSLIRARAEVRQRATRADAELSASNIGSDVPSYRLRESRFVPREHYHRAIERANELRASRSRDVSRSPSRVSQHTPAQAVPAITEARTP